MKVIFFLCPTRGNIPNIILFYNSDITHAHVCKIMYMHCCQCSFVKAGHKTARRKGASLKELGP